MTFGTLTLVVNILLLRRAESLPNYAHILSGLREDFRWGVGKLTLSLAGTTTVVQGKGAWTAWDSLEIYLGNITLREFLTYFEKE